MYEKIGNRDGLPVFRASPGATPPEERRRILGLSEHSDELSILGNRLRSSGRYEASAVAFRRALADTPDNPFLLNGLGASLWFLAKYGEAERCYKRALARNPADAGTHSNYGTLCASLGRVADMRRLFRRALEIEPGGASTRWNYAMALLDLGFWEEAWPHYEVRMEYRGEPQYSKLPYPKWAGEDLDGKTLFVMCEQGYGDRILFARYFSWIHEKWPTAKILYIPDVPPMPDMRLLLWGYRDFVTFLPPGCPYPVADYGLFLMSLPGVHGSTPKNVPSVDNLVRDVSRVEGIELPAARRGGESLKVGVCWTGNPLMLGNKDRSVPLELLLELSENPRVVLYGLQFAPGNADIERLGAEELICDLSRDIGAHGGFRATAAVMQKLDLVITVCTANAHLAGTLGVPTWVLLCRDPYWTWLRGRDTSVWYPSTRLYRQTHAGNWRTVIDDVKIDLEQLTARRLAA